MNAQLQMPLSRSTDPLSSHIAADSIRPHIESQEETVMKVLGAHPGFTSRELAQRLRIQTGGNEEKHHQIFHRRLPGLRTKGKVVNGQMRTCRVSGRLSQTWEAV